MRVSILKKGYKSSQIRLELHRHNLVLVQMDRSNFPKVVNLPEESKMDLSVYQETGM